jgi:hypothetical protein
MPAGGVSVGLTPPAKGGSLLDGGEGANPGEGFCSIFYA